MREPGRLAWTIAAAVWSLTPLALLTSNPGLTALSAASLGFIALVTWRSGEPPVMLLACGFQWLQGATLLLYADYLGVPLDATSRARHVEDATALTLVAVTVLALGMRLGAGRRTGPTVAGSAVQVSAVRLFIAYAGIALLLVPLEASGFGGLSQVVGNLRALRWVPVLSLFVVVLGSRSGWAYLFVVLAVELATGWLSFFAGFKVPLYVFALALLADVRRFQPSRIALLASVVAITVTSGVVWTEVKMEYRDFVSGYTGAQVIVVSADERASKLVELTEGLEQGFFGRGLERLAERVTYVEYFARAMAFVPSIRAHEEGRLLLGALQHVVMPRILFPDKPGIDDTTMTEAYTGLSLRGDGQTSISLGYPAECYIDFGPLFMHVPILLLGFMYGSFFRFFARRSTSLTAMSFAVVQVLGATTIESALTKALGGPITLFFVSVVVWYATAERFDRWIYDRQGQNESTASRRFAGP